MSDRRNGGRDESSDEEVEMYLRPKSLPSPPKSPNSPSSPQSPSAHYMRVDADEEAQLLSPGQFHFHGHDDDDDDDDDDAAAEMDALEAGERLPAEEQGLTAKSSRLRRWRWWPRRGGGDLNGAAKGIAGAQSRTARLGFCGLRMPPWLAKPVAILRLFPWDGPDELVVHSISPVFPNIQDYPARWLEYRLGTGTAQRTALALFCGLWLLLFTLVLSIAYSGFGGSPPIVHLSCTDTFWPRGNECGLDGIDCKPFSNHTFTFHCPAGCAATARLPEPRAVGSELLESGPVVIGSGFYRGDSDLCAAAIHTGVLSDRGGCGIIHRRGPGTQFHASDANGVRSTAFDSYFPMAFTVAEAERCGISDPALPLLLLDLSASVVLCVAALHPAALFFPATAAVFAHVALASDPPPVSHHATAVLPERLSVAAARLLPAAFVAAAVYRVAVRRALGGDFPRTGLLPLRAQYEKVWLWLLPLWLGATANHTLGWALRSALLRPLAVAAAVAAAAAAAAHQARALWREGRLPAYARAYAVALPALLLAAALLPGVRLHLPPYAVALALLPLTAVQTRPSLAFQAALLGVLAAALARDGFAPLLRVPEPRPATPLPVLAAAPVIAEVPASRASAGLLSIAFEWAAPPPAADPAVVVEGISVLVNDVERHRAFFQEPRRDKGHGAGGAGGFVWARAEGADFPEYFRFGFIREGKHALEYTRPGVWNANGTWTPSDALS